MQHLKPAKIGNNTGKIRHFQIRTAAPENAETTNPDKCLLLPKPKMLCFVLHDDEALNSQQLITKLKTLISDL
jgi:hypothetical protein